jgi:hypothetical protein
LNDFFSGFGELFSSKVMLKNRDRPDEYASHAYVTFVDPKITKEIASKTEPLRFMARDLEI